MAENSYFERDLKEYPLTALSRRLPLNIISRLAAYGTFQPDEDF